MNAIPEFFGLGEAETMFGWLHPAAPASDRRTIVVLCPPLGVDHICSYRTWRILAERLATAGFGVLRFDYLGTGNSAQDVDQPQQVARWQQSVARAVEHGRARTGANQVVLIGLRLGATLAACTAPDLPGVDSLVLWSPFRTGQRYAREAIARTRLSRPEAVDESGGDVEVTGFLMTRATIEELRGIDVLALRTRPASRVLLIERDDFPSDPLLLARLTQLGCAVTVDRTPGTVDALATPMLSKVPESILNRIVAWLAAGYPVSGPGDPVSCPRDGGAGQGDGWREEPLFFGPDHRLFGILTRPASNEPPATAVVFLNTGSGYHGGPHRMYVPMARALARAGHASFRFDLGGIGDSRSPKGGPDNEAYPAHAMEDVAAAIAEVQQMTQARRLVLIGMCAGGWHAFLAARDGLPVDGILAINPPLYLREGPHYKGMELVEQAELGRYTRSIADPEKWKRVIRGHSDVGTTLRIAAVGALRWLRARSAAVGLPLGRNGLGNELRAIAKRNVSVSLVFSRGDLGLTYFQLHARGQTGCANGLTTWTVVDGADHTFEPLRAQRALGALIRDFLNNGGKERSGGPT